MNYCENWTLESIKTICKKRNCKAVAFHVSDFSYVAFRFSDNMDKTLYFDCHIAKGGKKALVAMARQYGIIVPKTA